MNTDILTAMGERNMSDLSRYAAAIEIGGYRMQLTLIDLVDLTLQVQHLRWNLVEEEALRTQLDDFDALVRAGSDTVAERLRELGVAPDGRIAAAYLDQLFEPLPAGPIDAKSAVTALSHRLSQLGGRIRESLESLGEADPDSAQILQTLTAEISQWIERFKTGG